MGIYNSSGYSSNAETVYYKKEGGHLYKVNSANIFISREDKWKVLSLYRFIMNKYMDTDIHGHRWGGSGPPEELPPERRKKNRWGLAESSRDTLRRPLKNWKNNEKPRKIEEILNF